jgi:predicted RNA polymerase sigma factor
MSEHSTEQIRELLDSLYRPDSGRILATLIRLLGDFDLAEDARSLCGCAEPVAEEWSTRQPATMVDFDGPIQSH